MVKSLAGCDYQLSHIEFRSRDSETSLTITLLCLLKTESDSSRGVCVTDHGKIACTIHRGPQGSAPPGDFGFSGHIHPGTLQTVSVRATRHRL